MTVPGRPALFAAIVLGIILLGIVIKQELLYVAVIGDGLIISLCIWEGRRLVTMPVVVQREGDGRFQIDHSSDFVYRVENRGRRPVIVNLRQLWPESIEAPENVVEFHAIPGEILRVALTATPHKRGRIKIPAAEIDIRFPHGWSRRRWDLDDDTIISVYPDLKSLYAYDALRRSRALSQFGVHHQRMLGAGREFEQLREYGPDDDYREINWKATARRRKPITNVYQAERSQDVLLCLDCGRMMGNPVGNGIALDSAIDASIMLAHAANRQGDRIGLALFTESVDLLLKPKCGATAVNRIIEELVDTEPEGVFPSYAALVETLRVSHKRRSMIFIFTDLNDPQLASDLAKVLPLISRRHVVVVVSLRDPMLHTIADGPADSARGAYHVFAARELVTERDARARDLLKHGIQVLEADAGALSMEVINNYLKIKARQMI